LDRARGEIGGVQAGVGEIEQRAALPVLGEVLLVHLHDVGEVDAGGLGGELVPVAAPLAGLEGDRDIGLDLLVGVDDVLGVLVAGGVAPPGQAQRGGAVLPTGASRAPGGVGAAGGEGGQAGD